MKVLTDIYNGLALRQWYNLHGEYRPRRNIGYKLTEDLIAEIDSLYDDAEESWQVLFEIIEEIFGDEFNVEQLSYYISNYAELIEDYNALAEEE